MKKSLLCESLSIAYAKLERHTEYGRFMHWTFIVQQGRILEWGRNHEGSPAKHLGYHRQVICPKIHSELDAYRKARGLLDRTKPWDAINVRLNKRGELRNSRPCNCCFNFLKALGCREICYTNEGWFFNYAKN